MQTDVLIFTLASALALPFAKWGVKPKTGKHESEWWVMETGLQQRVQSIRQLPTGTVAGLALCGLAMAWLASLGFRHGGATLPVVAAAVIATDCFAAMAYAWWLSRKVLQDANPLAVVYGQDNPDPPIEVNR